MKVVRVPTSNLNHTTITEATLQFSHPENLELWPEPSSKNSSFQYRLRRLNSQHFAVHFFPQVSSTFHHRALDRRKEGGVQSKSYAY